MIDKDYFEYDESMDNDDYCSRCGLENTNGFAMAHKGHSYCPECWYYVMNLLHDKLDYSEAANQRSKNLKAHYDDNHRRLSRCNENLPR